MIYSFDLAAATSPVSTNTVRNTNYYLMLEKWSEYLAAMFINHSLELIKNNAENIFLNFFRVYLFTWITSELS